MGLLMNANTIVAALGVIVALLGLITAIVEKTRRASKSAQAAAAVAAKSASVAAKSVEVVREQVQNSHPKNLRDEQDDRHWEILANQKESLGVQAEILAAQAESRASQAEILATVRALREEDGRLFDLIVGNTQDIREIKKARRGRQTKGDTQ